MSLSVALSSLAASPQFLRRLLWLDVATCVAAGLLQLVWPGLLSSLLGLPEPLLVSSGWALFAYVAFIGVLLARPALPPAGVGVLIAGNALWVLGCLILLFGGLVTPTLLGKAFVAVQAVAVGLIAEMQWFGLRRGAAQPAW